MSETQLDLSLLKVGDVLSNYPNLCQKLGIARATGGRNQELQKKEIQRYIRYENAGGQKLRIIEIYDAPLPKVDGRANGNNSVYINEISRLLLNFICEEKDRQELEAKKIYINRRQLYPELGFCVGSFSKKEITEDSGIDSGSVNYFHSKSKSKFNDMLEPCLNRLKNEGKIKDHSVCVFLSKTKSQLLQLKESMIYIVVFVLMQNANYNQVIQRTAL